MPTLPPEQVEPLILSRFPGLRNVEWAITSPATPAYNCIAWAAGDQGRWWWPDQAGYWPVEPREATVAAFLEMLESLGFSLCIDDTLEQGSAKVALFAKGDAPTHAARQLASGLWTSKLGQSVDITHPLVALEGDLYGSVAAIVQRRSP
jgi:hypothetical protein